jgi:hypothetical protein
MLARQHKLTAGSCCGFTLWALLCTPLSFAQFADLTIQNIRLTPTVPQAGQTVEVEVEIQNLGNTFANPPFDLLLFEDVSTEPPIGCGQEDQRQTIEDLIPTLGASSRYYRFNVTYPAAGSPVILAVIDGCQDITEGNEENNMLTRPLTVSASLPDLQIDSITASTQNLRPDEAFNVTVVARNVGPASAGAFRLTLVANSAGEPDEQTACDAQDFEYIIGPVPANIPVSRTFSLTFASPGAVRLWAIVDSCGNAVEESNETNNAQSLDLFVVACTDSDNDGICDDQDPCDDINQATNWYRDADGDGYGDPDDSLRDCTAPEGYVDNDTDCDDTDANIHPASPVQCEAGIDRNCNGVTDDQEQASLWQADLDSDGFTDPSSELQACTPPEGFVQPSDSPDPDDADFLVPEPVTATPLAMQVPRGASGRSTPENLILQRTGAEPFSFSIDQSSIPAWLNLEPLSGMSDGGLALIATSVNLATVPENPGTIEVSITINGNAQITAPITVESRSQILTIRHSGQGGGYVSVEFDDEPNDPFNDYTFVILVDSTQNILEGSVEIPVGRSAFVRAYTEGDCSTLTGIYDEAGNRINDPNWFYWQGDYDPNSDSFEPPCEGCQVHPTWVRLDGDRTITADYTLSGLACTACGMIMTGLSGLGLLTTRRRLASI